MMGRERIIADIVLLVAVLFLPYWIYVPLIGAAMILFPLFWEAIACAFIVEALYGTGSLKLPLLAALLLAALLPVREQLRFSF